MSLFKVFPIEYVPETEDGYGQNDGNDDKQMQKEQGDEEEKENKEVMDRVFVIRMNMKTIQICHQFVDYWKLNLLQETEATRKRVNYYDCCYKWLHASLKQLSLEDSQNVNVNRKIMIQLFQILKQMVDLFDEQKQLELLLCVENLVH